MKQRGPQQWPLCYPLSTWPTSHWRSEARMQRLHMLQKKQRKILILLWNLWLWMSVLHWLSWRLLAIFLPLKPMLLPLNGHWGQPLSQILRLAVLCPQIPLNAIFHMHIVPLQQSHLHPRPPWKLQLQQKQQGIAQAKAPWQLSHPEEQQQMHLMHCLRKWSVTCSHHMIQIPAFLATWMICRSMMRTRIVWRLRVYMEVQMMGLIRLRSLLADNWAFRKQHRRLLNQRRALHWWQLILRWRVQWQYLVRTQMMTLQGKVRFWNISSFPFILMQQENRYLWSTFQCQWSQPRCSHSPWTYLIYSFLEWLPWSGHKDPQYASQQLAPTVQIQ